ncbi:MAG: GntR family transcriptional regulator [Deltaproteobacteria bacterium]|nr:GntR family transcriptional regulator [Deltaproteobacteria bacterium]
MSEKKTRNTGLQEESLRVTRALRQEIYSGLRLPRERLVEAALCETFSVSRMVIRQVLNTLKGEGLVVIEPYKGARVASISIDRMLESYQVLSVLEGFAAGLAARRLTSRDLKKLRAILDQQRNIEGGDVRKWQELNHDFHRLINLRCGNQKLVDMIRQNMRFTTYWFLLLSTPGRIGRNIQEHENVVAAFEKKDGNRARNLMERHILGAGEYLTKHLEASLPLLQGRTPDFSRADPQVL